MAKHEFGIMMDAPQPGKRYDKYEPWKYDCISVDDDYVEGIAEKLGFIDFYWHTLRICITACPAPIGVLSVQWCLQEICCR